jgi:hypothetical protein
VHTDRCGSTSGEECHPKGSKKEIKYKSYVEREIQGVWSMQCKIVSVIIGATETVSKGLKINVEAIPGKLSVYSTQKTAILGTYNTVQ